MNILHINNYLSGGGAESVFRQSINTPGHNNYTAYIKRNPTEKEGDINFATWENEGKLIGAFHYIYSPANAKKLTSFLEQNKIDIVHLHGFFSAISPSILSALSKAKKRSNIKVIQTLHDFHPLCPNSSFYNFGKGEVCNKCLGKKLKYHIFFDSCDRRGSAFSIVKGIRSFTAGIILNHTSVVDLFISPSRFLKNKMVDDGIDERKIRIIRNPVAPAKAELNGKEKKNIICYLGRFSREKNLSFMLKSFIRWKENRNNDYKLVLYGEGEEEKTLRKTASQSKYSGSIIFRPFLPQAELFREIEECKYFALTSSCYENSPMSIIEALSLNIIPIVPDLGGMAESVNEIFKIGRTYKPEDQASWGDALDLLESGYANEFGKFSSLDPLLEEFRNYNKNLDSLYKSITAK